MPLTDRTELRLARLFDGVELEQARRLLESECSEDVPGWQLAGLERLHAAVLKLSNGSIPKLLDAVVLAQTDVRDALASAGFGDDPKAHEGWLPERRSA